MWDRFLLLGARREWPQDGTAEDSDEGSSLHLSLPRCYSITSSARASTDGGMVRPRALAVLRLMTSSNFVGCSTGRSAGLAPLRILPTRKPVCRHVSRRLGP